MSLVELFPAPEVRKMNSTTLFAFNNHNFLFLHRSRSTFSRGELKISVQYPLHYSSCFIFFHLLAFTNTFNLLVDIQIEWTPSINNRELADVLPNGTLIFYPFAVEKYQHELHTSVYRWNWDWISFEAIGWTFFFLIVNRCKLKNPIGTVLSREVHVKAGELLLLSVKYAINSHTRLKNFFNSNQPEILCASS